MNKEKLTEITENISEQYITEALSFAPAPEGGLTAADAFTGKKRLTVSGRCVLAACLALLFMLGAAGIGIAAEAGSYRAAAAFFSEYGLSAEGLSRAEIKAVYRDITTRRFENGATAQVLLRTVPGLWLGQAEPTPEDLKALWDENVWRQKVPAAGYGYRIDYTEKTAENGVTSLEKSVVECFKDGVSVWTAVFPSFYVEKCVHTSVGTAVWGQIGTEYYFDDVSQFYRVDDTGNILWGQRLRHGARRETIAAVTDNGDGTWAVFSRNNDTNELCVGRFAADGTELSVVKTAIGSLWVKNAVKLGDGYLVQLWNSFSGDTARLAKLDADGSLTESFTYEEADRDYTVTDMAEYGGQVYLSAYAVPKQTDEGGRHEIANILDYVFQKENWEISSDELTPLVRDNYTAVLLLCGPAGGAPQTFYAAEGSLGGRLTVNEDGLLQWDVESVYSAFFSPATSSFTIGGTCRVFRYTFGEDGRLLRQEDTGETTPYRR